MKIRDATDTGQYSQKGSAKAWMNFLPNRVGFLVWHEVPGEER